MAKKPTSVFNVKSGKNNKKKNNIVPNGVTKMETTVSKSLEIISDISTKTVKQDDTNKDDDLFIDYQQVQFLQGNL